MGRRLLLINPAMRAAGRRLPNAGGTATMEPLGLAYVAALTPTEWEVRLVDTNVGELTQRGVAASGMNLCRAVMPDGMRCDNLADPRCGCTAPN